MKAKETVKITLVVAVREDGAFGVWGIDREYPLESAVMEASEMVENSKGMMVQHHIVSFNVPRPSVNDLGNIPTTAVVINYGEED